MEGVALLVVRHALMHMHRAVVAVQVILGAGMF